MIRIWFGGATAAADGIWALRDLTVECPFLASRGGAAPPVQARAAKEAGLEESPEQAIGR